MGSNNALQDVLMAGRKVTKSSHFGSIAGIKHPTMSVWLPFCLNKHTNIHAYGWQRGGMNQSYIE